MGTTRNVTYGGVMASPFQVLSSKSVLRTPVFKVVRERFAGPSGLKLERSIVRHPGAVAILARDPKGEVLLVRQFRFPLRKRLWELPAGKLEPKESVLRAAKRELAEETGYHARTWRKLLDFYPSPGFCDERIASYLAEELHQGTANPEPYELIQYRWFPWQKALAMVNQRVIKDGKTIATLLYAARMA